MSHPDPQHDDENSRSDDDLLRDECDARRREDERDAWDEAHAYDSARDCSIRTAAYATNGPIVAGGETMHISERSYRENIYNAQMRANHTYSDSLKGKR